MAIDSFPQKDGFGVCAHPDSQRVVVIEAGHGEKNYWSDLWAYRELLEILAWRDLAVRYKQTAVGVVWALAKPFLAMIIFTFIFSRIAKLPSEGSAPYVLMVLGGLLPWALFSTILIEASTSLVTNSNLIGKIYFPRLLIPASTCAVAVVDFLITLGLLACMMLYFGYLPDLRLLLLPLFAVLAVLAGLGPALIMATMNVKYRDFRFILPFVMQLGLYVSPVGFSSSVVPEEYRLLYSLNPAVGVIDGFRWCLFRGEAELYIPGVVISAGTTVLLLLLGVRYFRGAERRFADII